MNRVKVISMVGLAAAVGASGAHVLARSGQDNRAVVSKAEPAKAPVGSWRYQCVGSLKQSELADKANEEGAKGWEVDQIVLVPRNVGEPVYTLLFRRRAPGAKD